MLILPVTSLLHLLIYKMQNTLLSLKPKSVITQNLSTCSYIRMAYGLTYCHKLHIIYTVMCELVLRESLGYNSLVHFSKIIFFYEKHKTDSNYGKTFLKDKGAFTGKPVIPWGFGSVTTNRMACSAMLYCY